MKVIIHQDANNATKDFFGIDQVIDILDDDASIEMYEDNELPTNYRPNPNSKTGY